LLSKKRSELVRAVVQRVSQATVRVGEEELAAMGCGLLALVGVASDDSPDDARELARKLVHLRIFPDAEQRMNRSLLEVGGTLGVVSQFTLYGDVRKGRRPFFGAAAAPERAKPLVDAVVEAARGEGASVVTGRFRAQMEVSLVNEGPVTILIDTRGEF
jgi:D-tyrosyl-tRNA(Tyr) deacylase